MYKALRVPVALLHQKVYDTSVRLDKRVALPAPKKEVEKPISEIFYTSTLRRAFYKKNNVLHCRACNAPCPRVQDRTNHYGGDCRNALQYVMNHLWCTRACSVCKHLTSYGVASGNPSIDQLPVCSEKCAQEWEGGNPEAFIDQLVQYFVSRAD